MRKRLRNVQQLLPPDVAAVLAHLGWRSLAQAAKARQMTTRAVKRRLELG